MGSSSATVPTPIDVNTIEIIDSDINITTISLPHTVQPTDEDIKAYTACLSSLTVFSIPLTFSPTDIPVFRDKYQIPDGVRIRAPGPKERACYYRPGEVCFFKSAFEHGLRFPMDDHLRELLAALDLAPV